MSAKRKREQETEVERGRRRGGSAIERNPKNQTDLYTSCGSVVMAPDGLRLGGREGEVGTDERCNLFN